VFPFSRAHSPKNARQANQRFAQGTGEREHSKGESLPGRIIPLRKRRVVIHHHSDKPTKTRKVKNRALTHYPRGGRQQVGFAIDPRFPLLFRALNQVLPFLVKSNCGKTGAWALGCGLNRHHIRQCHAAACRRAATRALRYRLARQIVIAGLRADFRACGAYILASCHLRFRLEHSEARFHECVVAALAGLTHVLAKNMAGTLRCALVANRLARSVWWITPVRA